MRSQPQSILHVGGWPLPLGGVAVHVQRLAGRCFQAGLDVAVFDPYGARGTPEPAPFEIHRPNRSRIANTAALLTAVWSQRRGWIHFHASRLVGLAQIAIPLLLVRRRSSFAVSIHGSFVHSWVGYGRWMRANTRLLLRRADLVIVANEEIASLLQDELGVSSERLLVVPAYIPPLSDDTTSTEEDDAVIERYESWRSDFKRQVFVTGAPRRLYGFDLLLEASQDPRLTDVGFVFSYYEWADGEPDYAARVLAGLEQASNAFLVTGLATSAYVALLGSSDVFVRATSQDGDSVAIREAIGLGVPVAASDCVPRPAGAMLFETGNSDSLADALVAVLESDTLGRCEDLPDTAAEIIDAYGRYARV